MHEMSFIIAAAVCLAVTIFSIMKEPRRIMNGFLIEIFVILVFCSIVVTANPGNFSFKFGKFLMYFWNTIIFLFGIILIVDFIVVIRKEGKSIPNILPLFFGVLTIVAACAEFRDLSYGVSGFELYVRCMSVIYKLALFVPIVIAAVLVYSIIYLLLPKSKHISYIIVLGCAIRKNGEVTPLLRGRLEKAVSWYKKCGSKAKIVVSGGQGSDEVISEAQAMKNYLLTQNIPEEQIIMESNSVNTRQNLLFSQKCIKEDGGTGDVLICSSNYHVLRAVFLARSLNIDAQGIGGHTALYYLPVAFFREYIAMIFQHKLLMSGYIVFAIVTGWMLL